MPDPEILERYERIDRVVREEERNRRRVSRWFLGLLVLPLAVGAGVLLFGHSDLERVREVAGAVAADSARETVVRSTPALESLQPALERIDGFDSLAMEQERQIVRLDEEQVRLQREVDDARRLATAAVDSVASLPVRVDPELERQLEGLQRSVQDLRSGVDQIRSRQTRLMEQVGAIDNLQIRMGELEARVEDSDRRLDDFDPRLRPDR